MSLGQHLPWCESKYKQKKVLKRKRRKCESLLTSITRSSDETVERKLNSDKL